MNKRQSFFEDGLAHPSIPFWFGTFVLLSLATQFLLLWIRDFDPDEFQHLHAAWNVSKGLIPYVDFFGHHTPGLWFLLAPLIRFYQPDTDFSSAVRLLFVCRILMWALSGLILVFTWKLGKLWRGTDVGAGAAVLLASTLMFLEKCIETRVDVPAPLAFITCLCLLLKAFKRNYPGKRIDFALAGVLFGCAIMITQKMLMALPGLALALGWYVLDNRIEGEGKGKLSLAALFWTSSLIPLLLVLVYFQAHHAVGDFFHNNFVLNSDWRMRFSPGLTFNRLLRQNLITTILGIAGFLTSLAAVMRRGAVKRGDFFLVFPLASFFAGAFIIPVPQREYFMEFLPLGALFAAYALTDFIRAFSRFGPIKSAAMKEALFRFRILILSAAICLLLVGRNNLRLVDKNGLQLTVVLILATAVLSAFFQSRWLKILAFAGLSIYGLRQSVKYWEWTNHETLNNLRYVYQRVGPTETLMDGWSGVGVFRPNAWYYYFLHTEIVYMLDRPQIQQLVAGFKAGTIAPKIIFLDEFIRAISPQLTDYLKQNYTSAFVNERGTFLIRRQMPYPPKKKPSYPPMNRAQLPLPGTFELVIQ